MPLKYFLLFVFQWLFQMNYAQIIHGEVYDAENKTLVPDVKILNIYSGLEITANENGVFMIAATGGQLLEFKKQGYQLLRVRIPQGFIPSYFRIALKKGLVPLNEITTENRYNYKEDSLKTYNLYKHELDYPTMSAIDMIAHPFSALSKRSQEIWKFQEEYTENEKEKYIDKTFNEELIYKFTGLKGDSARKYIRKYRPNYEQLRSMSDYTFFSYIKQTVKAYRNPFTPRGAQ